MSARIPVGTSPAALKRLCIDRYETSTGERWRDLEPAARERWLAETAPAIRTEEGIAADAVWWDGAWQPAGQSDLFADFPLNPNAGREAAA